MNAVQAVALGVVQGLTEFLPVSSSGHLVIISTAFGLGPNLPFDILLHLATLLAVCVYFIDDIKKIFKALITLRTKDPHFRMAVLVLVASVSTAIIGFLFEDTFEAMFSSLLYVGMFLLLTGVVIMVAEKYSKPRKKIEKAGILDAMIIGIAQGCAIAPGLSRSGTTVSASLLMGFDRELAARFSFILSIPAIIGATLFKINDIGTRFETSMLLGFLAAFAAGYAAIGLFMGMIRKRDIRPFALYCFVIGTISIIFSFI